MSKGSGRPSRLSRCMRAPIRVLCRVRDLYMKSMNKCADEVQCNSEFPHCYISHSARTSASDNDLQELIRASSLARARSLNLGQESKGAPVLRSQSVVIGRIDEDRPCDFKDDLKVGSDFLFPERRNFETVGVNRRVRVLAWGRK